MAMTKCHVLTFFVSVVIKFQYGELELWVFHFYSLGYNQFKFLSASFPTNRFSIWPWTLFLRRASIFINYILIDLRYVQANGSLIASVFTT